MLEYVFMGLMGGVFLLGRSLKKKIKVDRNLNLMLGHYLAGDYQSALSFMKNIIRKKRNRFFDDLYCNLLKRKMVSDDYIVYAFCSETDYGRQAEFRLERAVLAQQEIVEYLRNTEVPKRHKRLFDLMLKKEENGLQRLEKIEKANSNIFGALYNLN